MGLQFIGECSPGGSGGCSGFVGCGRKSPRLPALDQLDPDVVCAVSVVGRAVIDVHAERAEPCQLRQPDPLLVADAVRMPDDQPRAPEFCPHLAVVEHSARAGPAVVAHAQRAEDGTHLRHTGGALAGRAEQPGQVVAGPADRTDLVLVREDVAVRREDGRHGVGPGFRQSAIRALKSSALARSIRAISSGVRGSRLRIRAGSALRSLGSPMSARGRSLPGRLPGSRETEGCKAPFDDGVRQFSKVIDGFVVDSHEVSRGQNTFS